MRRLLPFILFLVISHPAFAQRVSVDGVSAPIFGAVTAATVNTGNGDAEVYLQNQNLRTTDTVRLGALNLGTAGAGAGVTVGNGTFIITGDGSGTDEVATIDLNSNNTITISSTSGVTTFNLGTIVATSGGYYLGGQLFASDTAPTISSGFGTSPSITAQNGTQAFRIDVGTGGTATGGVIGLPAATTGWNCYVNNTTVTANDHYIKQSASTTTTATIVNIDFSTGAAAAIGASNILAASCFAF